MAIIYTWAFSSFGKHDEGGFVDAVREVAYTVTASDGVNPPLSVNGNVLLPAPKAGTFIAFASITKQNAIDWATGLLDVPALKAGLAARLVSTPPARDIVTVTPPFGVL